MQKMFSQEQNYYESHTYISISCNRGQFDLKNPGFFKAICTCNQLVKFFCSFTYNNKQICSKKLFQNSVILQYIFISFNNSIHIGFSGIYSVEIIIVFSLITVFYFLTLASVLVIFPTFSDVPFSFFGEWLPTIRYLKHSFNFSKHSSSDD